VNLKHPHRNKNNNNHVKFNDKFIRPKTEKDRKYKVRKKLTSN